MPSTNVNIHNIVDENCHVFPTRRCVGKNRPLLSSPLLFYLGLVLVSWSCSQSRPAGQPAGKVGGGVATRHSFGRTSRRKAAGWMAEGGLGTGGGGAGLAPDSCRMCRDLARLPCRFAFLPLSHHHYYYTCPDTARSPFSILYLFLSYIGSTGTHRVIPPLYPIITLLLPRCYLCKEKERAIC